MYFKRLKISKAFKKKIKKAKKRFIKDKKIFGIILIFVGLFFFLFFPFVKFFSKISLEPKSEKESKTVKKEIQRENFSPIKIDSQLLSLEEPYQLPQRIIIPNLNIDLSIRSAFSGQRTTGYARG
ncbi:hypothetical protein ISS85_02610 [Candidatus Microgenomates bacterium]|nr:hypothetical protein [Candidatus Microgenomates bacterium]